MLFNSYQFILVFLPLSLGLFSILISRKKQSVFLAWLLIASIAFYGWWDIRNVPLLLASIVGNYTFGRLISGKRRQEEQHAARLFLILGIASDLSVLAYFKYWDFITSIFYGGSFNPNTLTIPLGISFFTFTQIAYLVDVYKAEASQREPLSYALFVSWFPHLIAGPIIHHKEVMPQFRNSLPDSFNAMNLAAGFTIFTMGLFKKVILADNLAGFISAANSLSAFTKAAAGSPINFFEGWAAALTYTLQLYFDFSGYSDMAIGLSLMFGVKLPLNFNSPYKSQNIADFWRRWHMTLSRFLRDYVYIPLGGNRCGRPRHLLNLFLTMLIGGVWHGAGWTFVVWGALHGTYLVAYNIWSQLNRRVRPGHQGSRVGRAAGWMVTFLAVTVAWVVFRASSLHAASRILAGMIGLNGFELVPADRVWLGPLASALGAIGIKFQASVMQPIGPMLAWVGPLLLVAWLAPNTQQMMGLSLVALTPLRERIRVQALRWPNWVPSLRWATVIAVMFIMALLGINRPTQFLYFQF